MQKHILGIDVGGSGIKGAVVDVTTGTLVEERIRLLTPQPATPKRMAKTMSDLLTELNWDGDTPIGCGFPAIVKRGTALSAANIDPSWIGTSVKDTFEAATGKDFYVMNDADAAGVAAMEFGHGQGHEGTLLFITIGSGLGSALFIDGCLIPNTEFGHFYIENGMLAESYASGKVKKREDLSWEEWGERFNYYLEHVERLVSPDLILLGGGGSKKFERFAEQITIQTEVKPSKLLNSAGIIGAACHVSNLLQKRAHS
jgi:polyphosphate glucokinase